MGWHGFARMLTEVVGSLRDVLLPRGCAGCDMPDAVLCDDCRASGGGFMSFAMPGTVSGRAIACGAYRGPLRRAILRWKDHGDEECDGPFAGPAGFGSDAGDDIGAGPILPAFDEGARTVAYA